MIKVELLERQTFLGELNIVLKHVASGNGRTIAGEEGW
jgi:hypothetical protein